MKLAASFNLLLAAILQASSLVNAAPADHDPCAAIAGKPFVVPSKALACLKSFAYNETIKANVLSNAGRVLDFFSFEPFYKSSPAPFQESTVQIRDQLSRINGSKYESDYDFNRDLFDVALSLNDGHTQWYPNCYLTFQNLIPAPIVNFFEGGKEHVYIAPDAAELVAGLGTNLTDLYDKSGFDWKSLAGAKVVDVDGKDVYEYIENLATTQAGTYLDHGIRVNSVFTSYRIIGSAWSQRFGLFASREFPDLDSLTIKIIPAGSKKAKDVKVPFYAAYDGQSFVDKDTYWEANCAVKETTNGVNRITEKSKSRVSKKPKLQPVAGIVQDSAPASAVDLPQEFTPTIPSVAGSANSTKSYILPDGETGVIYVSTFGPADFYQFQRDIASAVEEFTSKNVTKLIVDLHNNGGGYVCLGHFLFGYLGGKSAGYPGFESTLRANELSKKIVAANIELGINSSYTFFAPDGWLFVNNTPQPADYNYVDPSAPFSINGISDPTSQRFFDICQPDFVVGIPDKPAFEPENIALVGNGNCASTCALFSTLMYEKLGTKIATFGGRIGKHIEYKGMAGNQVLDWPLLDSEIKTAGLKDDPLAPPDLIIDGNFRINWRSAWSSITKQSPIAYVGEPPEYRFGYTNETYNDPQKLWIYSASQIFPTNNSTNSSSHN